MLVATYERPVQAISWFSSLLKGGVVVANLLGWQMFGVRRCLNYQRVVRACQILINNVCLTSPGPGHPAIQRVHAPSMRISGVTLSHPRLFIPNSQTGLRLEKWLARPAMQNRTCLAGDSCTWTIRFDCSVYKSRYEWVAHSTASHLKSVIPQR